MFKKVFLVSLMMATIFASKVAVAEDVADVVARSTVVAVIHVSAGTDQYIAEIDNGCGFAYEAFVSIGIKGSREGEKIGFRTPLPLMMSGSYLVFLSDVAMEENGSKNTFGVSIRSTKCAQSGIALTTVEYLATDKKVRGPEIVLERRLFQEDGSLRNDGRVEYFFAQKTLEQLFQSRLGDDLLGLVSKRVDVQRPNRNSAEIAFRGAELLDFLMRER